ncbi:PilZ domain-containing protein [Thermodesulfobacteriota bacterium]
MDNKRSSERKGLKVFLKVFDEMTDQLFGYLVDISNEGIMVTREQGVEIDSDFQLRVVLPAEIEGKKESRFSTQSRWSEKDSETEFFNAGFQFVDLSPSDKMIIKRLMQNFCFDTDTE